MWQCTICGPALDRRALVPDPVARAGDVLVDRAQIEAPAKLAEHLPLLVVGGVLLRLGQPLDDL